MKWRVTCRRCDRIVYVPLGVKCHWHHCRPKRRPSHYVIPTYQGITTEEKRSEIFAALYEAVGEEATARRLD